MSIDNVSLSEAKPWYQSKTIWAAIVTVAASGASLFGIVYSASEQAAAIDALVAVTTSLAGLAALFGRLAAKTRIRTNEKTARKEAGFEDPTTPHD